jgi:predicted secreted protein
MLGDFGKDTWIFTALNTGSITLKLECARPFNTTDIAQTFVVTINIQ